MTASALLDSLIAKNAVVSVDGGHLRIDAPRGAINQGELAAIKNCKAESIAIIAVRGSKARRLIGCGFPPTRTKPPPDSILADPIVSCRNCHRNRILPELTDMTRGLCRACWMRQH